MNTLYKLLDRLESVIMDGVPIPFLPFSLINQEKLIVLLDKIQTVIPDEIQQADQILTRSEELQTEAQRRAQQLMQDAKQQSERLISESELLKAVHQEAERIRHQVLTELQALRQQTIEETDALKKQAFEEASNIRHSADEYADNVLRTLSRNLDEFQQVSKNAQKHLRKTRAESMQAQHPSHGIAGGFFAPKGPKEAPQKPPSESLNDLEIPV